MSPFSKIKLGANVLPAVVVVAILMALGVLVVIALWEMESQLFARNNYDKARRADIRSAFVLYANQPEICAGDSVVVQLCDSVAHSEVEIRRRRWGLYEAVSVSSTSSGKHGTAIMGIRPDAVENSGLYYANNGGSLTITGNSNFHGTLHAPKNGIIYGQMRSVFFSGEKIPPDRIRVSEKTLPRPDSQTKAEADRLLELIGQRWPYMDRDSIGNRFCRQETLILSAPEAVMEHYSLSGNIILVADKVKIDSTCTLNDVIVVGKNITMGSGFRGTAQLFASDSLVLRERVQLHYPSGIYSANYAEMYDDCVVNGYAVVRAGDNDNVRQPNYKQSRQSRLRGLLYVNGNAQLQGIVSGPVYLSRAVYYSNEGYYKDMIYDATLLPNVEMAAPMWISDDKKREGIKWVD